MGKEDYIQTNVILLCDKGALPMPFIATPKMQNHHGITGGTIRDNIPLLNILPFGVCSVTTLPCLPVMPTWEDYPVSPWFVEGFQPLLLTSCAKCKLGGTIKIYTSYMDAFAAMSNSPKSLKDKFLSVIDKGIGRAMLGPVAPVLEAFGCGDIVSGVGEFGRGVVKGFGKGIVSTLEGIYNMVAHPLDTLGGIVKLVGVAVVGYSTPNPNPQERLAFFDKIFGTDLLEVDTGIKQALAETGDKLVHGTNEERGEVVGQAIEFIAEIAVGTKGAGAAMKSVKAGSMGSKAAKIANIADKAIEIVKATGGKIKKWTFDKLLKPIKGIFGKKKVPSYKHGQSDGGPGTWEHRTTPEKGAKYQEQVTGAPKDTEYVVKTDKMKSGEKKFDGYDPETNTLIDAKDWDKWPPSGNSKFDQMKINEEIKNIKNDSKIADDAGCNLEYHVPSEAKKEQILEMLGEDIPDNFDIIVTPK